MAHGNNPPLPLSTAPSQANVTEVAKEANAGIQATINNNTSTSIDLALITGSSVANEKGDPTRHAVDIARNTSASTTSHTLIPASVVEKTDLDDNDPFQLRDGILTEEQLIALRGRYRRQAHKGPFGLSMGSLSGLGMGLVGSGGTKKGRALEEYHVRQNNLIPELLKPIDEHTAEAEASDDAARLPVRIAVHASLWGNIILCIVQIYAAISSLSLSLISTGIDSVFDVGSNVSLFYLHRQAIKMRKNENKWPVGGARLECIGNIIFGFLMSAVNLVVVVESVRAIATKEGHDLHEFHLPSILAVSIALAVKGGLFLYCYGLRSKSSQVQILWEDHRNDVFLNGFAIVTSTGGSKIVWWLDPAGAIILGLFIIISWSRTIYGEFAQLAGKSAPHEFQQLLTYKAATFSDVIERVDTVRAYHSGPNYFVEVDVVMDGSTSLYVAHDLSQDLQDKLESLPGVERAFVHVDYKADHSPEHRRRKLT